MAPALFWSIKFERRVKKWPEPKKLLKQKIIFFMPVNYAKEFLNSLHTGVVFSELFSRASNGRQYSRSWNFQLKISLCSVFQHAEFKFHGCSWIWDFGFALVSIIHLLLHIFAIQVVFPYLSHRFCTEPLKMTIFGLSKQIFSAKNQLFCLEMIFF